MEKVEWDVRVRTTSYYLHSIFSVICSCLNIYIYIYMGVKNVNSFFVLIAHACVGEFIKLFGIRFSIRQELNICRNQPGASIC